MKKKRVVITMGDPTGIGPEIIVKALSDKKLAQQARYTIIGCRKAFVDLPGFASMMRSDSVEFIETACSATKWSSKLAGRASIQALDLAIQLLKAGTADALVTAPISKANAAKAGFAYPGHTEFLCDKFKVKRHAMMLFHSRLRVVLVTLHIPLHAVTKSLTQAAILEKMRLTADALTGQFGIKRPRIAVAGLNPHSGENGLFGDEENRLIVPAIRRFMTQKSASSIKVSGPCSPDSVFHDAVNGKYDAVICHYHDQGLIPLKVTGFDEGVNMTLGLPFVRTSPDHGTAFDIAGKNRANPESMRQAMWAAAGNFYGLRRKT